MSKTQASQPVANPATAKPQIEIIPLRAAVQTDADTELFVLVRVLPPQLPVSKKRPPLNLGIVLDRSGSMGGEKLEHAKAAAIYAVRQLQSDDRVAVTIFDNEVETIVPSTFATDKAAIEQCIRPVETRGTTALHAAWIEGGIQVSSHLERDRLNRVLLLTDGQANVGETNPDRICSDARGLSERGVSTSTLGVGLDYNEDLLEAMARSGDGNYHFIENTRELEDIFNRELLGLMATIGRKVSLGFEPQGKTKVRDVLNDLDVTEFGNAMLTNLIAGQPVEIVVKLKVPATGAAQERDICFFRLAYDTENGERIVVREVLSLPAVSSRDWESLPEDERAAHQIAHKQATRLRKQAVQEMERGNIAAAQQQLQTHADFVAENAASADWLQDELSEVQDLQQSLASGEVERARKLGKFASYRKSRSR